MHEARTSDEAALGGTMTRRPGRPRRRTVVATDGARLAVHESGNPDNPTVLLVHGFPDDHHCWDGVAAALEQDHHVVVLDTRGSGASDRPARTSAYRLDQLAADLREVAEAVAPGRPIHLVGHDWGSIQGWHLVTGPEQHGVVSFTSISGACLDHLPVWARARLVEGPQGWRKLFAAWKTPIYMTAFQIPVLGALSCRLGLVDAVISFAEKLEAGSKPPGREGQARANRAALKLYNANVFPRLLRPQRAGTDVPVQIVAARRDLFVPVLTQLDPHPGVTRHRVEIVDGGHWTPAYNPGPIAALVADWVRQHQPARPKH
ncbi:MAG: alpha/beta fold hydrolase [Segniliparus sp.]|uniref:alpha/beta fold hydrolase n=1 Tax=Segniliparus sp. TaxID=2804064 RepID=UPI003F3944B9